MNVVCGQVGCGPVAQHLIVKSDSIGQGSHSNRFGGGIADILAEPVDQCLVGRLKLVYQCVTSANPQSFRRCLINLAGFDQCTNFRLGIIP